MDQITRASLFYFDHENLEVLGNSIGSYIVMDYYSFYFKITSYARICVEINVTSLPERIHLDSPEHDPSIQEIEYPQFLYSNHCSMIGYSLSSC